ncbi:MAG: DUF2840 domain-containing protein [Aquamicrobium sp.]|uniref:DUF2840 domain-containing protein n=1 Tax=Mesorhizobium sp. Pch-S TaxID=2082387 RepID=UPI0010111A3C|nr:DUF2840 domain-containing protein [Mesorhizobium sp. Pch-S]MBR2686279.1 DUF2840 domain-containing protein [Aquamicrobium sp.]QAZ44113.1 glycosidase [Mesorhizobium sp. Pch-S]
MTLTSAELSPALCTDTLTTVELTWLGKKQEQWIRFGNPVKEQIVDRQRRIVSFRPDSVFALIRWAANDFGTTLSRIDIVVAVARGRPLQTLPTVRPGAEILLSMARWPQVELVLKAIDAIEQAGIDASSVSPEHWRHMHNRMTAGQAPRSYSPRQHHAFLLRRRVTS